MSTEGPPHMKRWRVIEENGLYVLQYIKYKTPTGHESKWGLFWEPHHMKHIREFADKLIQWQVSVHLLGEEYVVES